MAMIFLALGLVLVVEGLTYAIAPGLVERMLEMLRSMPESARRQMGLLTVVVGVILLWIAHQLGGLA